MTFGNFLKNAAVLYAAYSIIDKSIESRAKKMAKKMTKKEVKKIKKGKNYDAYEYSDDGFESDD